MTEEEWLEGLRGLPEDVILKITLTFKRKLRSTINCAILAEPREAIHYCQQQIALAPLAMSAMKKNHGMYDNGQFFAPWTSWLQTIRDDPPKQKDAAGLDALLKKKRRKDGQTKDVWFATIFLLLLMGIGI